MRFTLSLCTTTRLKDQLVAAMEAAGYTLDTLESTGDNLRFYGAAKHHDDGWLARM